jgi:cytochrome c553
MTPVARKAIRWFAIAAGGVIGVLALAAGVVYVGSERILDRRYSLPPGSIGVPEDAESIREGGRLARIHGCLAGCHGRDGEGAVMFDQPVIATIVAPNLTVIARRSTDAQLDAAIRHGLRPDGRSLIVMPTEAYRLLSDADLGRIIAHLRSLPPVSGHEASVTVGPIGRFGLLTGRFRTAVQMAAEAQPPLVASDESSEAGRNLAVTSCGHCHGVDLAGASTPEFTAPSLQVVAAYSPEAFQVLLRTGSALGGRELGVMSRTARANLSLLNDDEIDSLYRYLSALRAPAN